MNHANDLDYKQAKVGYFVQNPKASFSICGAVDREGKYYWCKRHRFWVNSRGICVDFSREEYSPNTVQCDFCSLFEDCP